HQKILARDHHVFIVTDSDWIFGNDNMGHHTNQVYFDSILQKLSGSDRVWETNDPATNYIDQNPHSLIASFLTGILPALILALVGYLYLSARRQMPTEAVGK
ncbi:MAG TPA: hypothetical protein VL860_02655, partial [Planctomycetota bacterium]|nr:hypothetical protein [Planctomycetota bacterium]